MGNQYTVIYEYSPKSVYIPSKKDYPLLVLGLDEVKFVPSDLNLGEEKHYYILSKNGSIFKQSTSVYKDVYGRELKLILRNYGRVVKVNDYYVFSQKLGCRMLIYDSKNNKKIFDHREHVIFHLSPSMSFNIYIL